MVMLMKCTVQSARSDGPDAPPFRSFLGQPIQMPRERFEAFEVVHRQEIVDEGECRLHPARQRLIVRRPEQGIEPDETMTAPLQPGDLAGEEMRLAAIPAIRYQ